MSPANPTGTVFLQGIHCNSESPRRHASAPSQSQGRKGTAAQIEHYRVFIPYFDVAHSQTTVIPKRFCDDQVNGDKDGGQHPKEGKGKYSKAGNCQLLSE